MARRSVLIHQRGGTDEDVLKALTTHFGAEKANWYMNRSGSKGEERPMEKPNEPETAEVVEAPEAPEKTPAPEKAEKPLTIPRVKGLTTTGISVSSPKRWAADYEISVQDNDVSINIEAVDMTKAEIDELIDELKLIKRFLQ